MNREKIIVIDFGGQYNQLYVSAMFIVRSILTELILKRSKK